jgi:hypothetical protein
MGHGSYSIASRTTRASTLGYATKTVNEIFHQNVEQRIHKDMNPLGVKLREACDSVEHPNTIPVQLYLDVTGSMGHIPHELIKTGLPTLIGKLQTSIPDITLMFGAVGDHECDQAPLQIAQFESGDAELDMWLTRTWLEGRGGGNEGESYLLAWYFAGFHTKLDSFDKRKQKGYVFTVGDEPCLKNLPGSALRGIMGDTAIQGQGNYSCEQLLEKAQEQNEVYHIHVDHGATVDPSWKVLMGSNLIVIDDHTKLVDTISDTILSTLVLPSP